MEYERLVEVYKKLEQTTKRLEKTSIVSDLLSNTPESEIPMVIQLLEGRVFPEWDERKIGFSSKLVLRALAKIVGAEASEIEKKWSKTGDLGEVAEEMIKKKKQTTFFSSKLTIDKVTKNIRRLAEMTGEGAVDKKVSCVSELLAAASPSESRFIVRTVLEDLRVGIALGVIRDAIAQAYNKDVKDVENAFAITVDYGEVAKLAKQDKLHTVALKPGKPLNSMLAVIAESVEEAFEDFGKEIQCEQKLDGFRIQIHKDHGDIQLFTRRMENVTKQFPDVVSVAKSNIRGKSYILDAEAVGYNRVKKRYLPFQSISQRIRRKYDINEIASKFPVEVDLFDIVFYNNKSLMNEPLRKRRELLESIIKPEVGIIRTTEKLVTSSMPEAKKFFNKSLACGNEGIMIKNLESVYRPGRYVGGWSKLKQILEPLDLVIVGAEYGTGKRAGALSSFVLACREGKNLLECGMVSTGVKEKEQESGVTYNELTKILKPLIVSQSGRSVKIKPKIVVEVLYEEVQKSPTYASGFALRFPRFNRLRTEEKKVNDANSIEDVKRIFNMQKRKI